MFFIEKQDIIDTNKTIISDWNDIHPNEQQYLCVRNEVLEDVFTLVNKIDDKSETQKNLIQKTSYLMGAISWTQPFCDGNKRTGLLIAATVLYRNGVEFEPFDDDLMTDVLCEIQEERVRLSPETWIRSFYIF